MATEFGTNDKTEFAVDKSPKQVRKNEKTPQAIGAIENSGYFYGTAFAALGVVTKSKRIAQLTLPTNPIHTIKFDSGTGK